MVNLTNYPITKELKASLEKLRRQTAPKGFKPMPQAKFIEKLLQEELNAKTNNAKKR